MSIEYKKESHNPALPPHCISGSGFSKTQAMADPSSSLSSEFRISVRLRRTSTFPDCFRGYISVTKKSPTTPAMAYFPIRPKRKYHRR